VSRLRFIAWCDRLEWQVGVDRLTSGCGVLRLDLFQSLSEFGGGDFGTAWWLVVVFRQGTPTRPG